MTNTKRIEKGHLTAELLTANKEPLGWCILNRPQVVHFNRPVTTIKINRDDYQSEALYEAAIEGTKKQLKNRYAEQIK